MDRDSYRADVRKRLVSGCVVCSDVEMVVDGKNTMRCRKHLRAEGGVCFVRTVTRIIYFITISVRT